MEKPKKQFIPVGFQRDGNYSSSHIEKLNKHISNQESLIEAQREYIELLRKQCHRFGKELSGADWSFRNEEEEDRGLELWKRINELTKA